MIENIAITFADILLNDINKIINDTKRENKMLLLKDIWHGIRHGYATDEEILIFIEAYEESDGYKVLSDKALFEYTIFKRIITKELSVAKPGKFPPPLLYYTVKNFMYDFGTNLSK